MLAIPINSLFKITLYMNTALKVAIISHDIAWEDKDDNLITIAELLHKVDKDTDVVVLPELFSTGFVSSVEKLHEMAETDDGKTILSLKRWAQHFNVAICGSFLMNIGSDYYNRGFFVEPSGDVQYYNKRHLYNDDLEKRSYKEGVSKSPIVRYRGWNISMQICYDIKFPVWCRNIDDEIDLLLVPANWPKDKEYEWKHLLIARAIENQYYVVGANRSGSDDIGKYQNSYIFDFKGEDISTCSTKFPQILYANLNKQELREFRKLHSTSIDADKFIIL